MKITKILIGIGALMAVSCEDIVDLDLNSSESELVVDAWLTDQNIPQVVKLRQTIGYFQAENLPSVIGASVSLVDELGNTFAFTDSLGTGNYTYNPAANGSFAEVGRDYTMLIDALGERWTAESSLRPVPEIDSIVYEFREESIGEPEGYYAEFYARDLPGRGDAYWIKTWKNEQFLNKPQEINISFDGAFSPGGAVDGQDFIGPIRSGINREPDSGDGTDDGSDLPPYNLGDSIYVEIHAITPEAFFFLLEARTQMDRAGGIAELFAPPIANVASNITAVGSEKTATGFFGMASVSSLGVRIIEEEEEE